LLAHGADANKARALYVCRKAGHRETARLLLDNGAADIDNAADEGRTLLVAACRSGAVDAARRLLESNGATTLHAPRENGKIDAARLLIKFFFVFVFALIFDFFFPSRSSFPAWY